MYTHNKKVCKKIFWGIFCYNKKNLNIKKEKKEKNIENEGVSKIQLYTENSCNIYIIRVGQTARSCPFLLTLNPAPYQRNTTLCNRHKASKGSSRKQVTILDIFVLGRNRKQ